MEFETHEDGLLFDHSSSNPSLERRPGRMPAVRRGEFAPQKGERIPEEEDQLA